MKKHVLLGFSGGIDSCASALWLQEKGYRVTAVTLNTTGDAALIAHARDAALRLGVEQFTDDVRELFEHEVIGYFADEYLRGATPSPCVRCNVQIKWRRLYHIAQERGFDHIATGHYFRIVRHAGKFYVARGADPAKDQSYYLWGLGQAVLQKALTPMGDQLKSDVKRRLASDFPARESMGICFLQGRSYADFLRERHGEFPEGEIADRHGTILGAHHGYPFYTIGQRRGFPGAGGTLPCGMAVTGIDPVRNRVIAGDVNELLCEQLIVQDYYVPDLQELLHSNDISIRIRGIGRNPAEFIKIEALSGNRLGVQLGDPAWAVAEGQPAVFYRGDRVVGGGYLTLSAIP